MARTERDKCTCGHERGRHEHWDGRCLQCIEQIGCVRFTSARIQAGTIMSPQVTQLSDLEMAAIHAMVVAPDEDGVIVYEKISTGKWVRLRKGFITLTNQELLALEPKLYMVWAGLSLT